MTDNNSSFFIALWIWCHIDELSDHSTDIEYLAFTADAGSPKDPPVSDPSSQTPDSLSAA